MLLSFYKSQLFSISASFCVSNKTELSAAQFENDNVVRATSCAGFTSNVPFDFTIAGIGTQFAIVGYQQLDAFNLVARS